MSDSGEITENRPKRPKTPGSGRKRGTPNRSTVARQQLVTAITATDVTPLEFLLAILRSDSPLVDLRTKMEAARIAAPYCHAKAGEAPSDADVARIIECEDWSDAQARRLEILRQEREKKL